MPRPRDYARPSFAMTLATLGIDAYQLTTLVAHADAGRLDHRVAMSFFFRKLPRARNFVVFAGLRAVLDHAAQMRFDEAELAALRTHPLLGPALDAHPAVMDALRALDGFEGDIDAIPEGTLAYAGPGVRTDGTPLEVAGAPLQLYIPLMQVKTDMVRAKLLETPWLGYVNHMSMIASKAARVVMAAAGKPVFEFGARRTHPAAAVDASYAAYVGGTDATSNLAAFARYGVPAVGTMDHFAVQAAERVGVAVETTEGEFYAAFTRLFPSAATLLVDTYDTDRGLRDAVRATQGRVTGVRIDSNVTPGSIAHARSVLDGLGAQHVKIYVSDGLDEHRVRELFPVADGFGVGENISCSPDAATGVGAVAKLVVNGYGKVTMKLAKGTGKATLPGELQAWRASDHDLLALAGEAGPAGAAPLLEPVWRGRAEVRELPPIADSRAYVKRQIAALPEAARALGAAPEPRRKIVASDALVALISKLTKEAGL
jgi:nicotinate phosphoribosyltransferase